MDLFIHSSTIINKRSLLPLSYHGKQMKVSAKAQYACTAMIELAFSYSDSQLVRIKTISDNHSISSRFLVQILLQLKTAGLVVSTRGATGGYQLARSPEQITVADILGAVEDRGNDSPNSDSSPTTHVLSAIWQEVQEEEQRILKKHTLADLVRRLEEPSSPNYQI